jgi:hypothetical protein
MGMTGVIEELSISKCRGEDPTWNAGPGVCRKGDMFQMLELASITTPERVREKLRFAVARTDLRSSQQFG